MRLEHHRIGNGSKQLGLIFWWNDSRKAVELNLGVHQFTLMRENR